MDLPIRKAGDIDLAGTLPVRVPSSMSDHEVLARILSAIAGVTNLNMSDIDMESDGSYEPKFGSFVFTPLVRTHYTLKVFKSSTRKYRIFVSFTRSRHVDGEDVGLEDEILKEIQKTLEAR